MTMPKPKSYRTQYGRKRLRNGHDKRKPFDAEKQRADVQRWIDFMKPTGSK